MKDSYGPGDNPFSDKYVFDGMDQGIKDSKTVLVPTPTASLPSMPISLLDFINHCSNEQVYELCAYFDSTPDVARDVIDVMLGVHPDVVIEDAAAPPEAPGPDEW